jgi:hypothetical protein
MSSPASQSDTLTLCLNLQFLQRPQAQSCQAQQGLVLTYLHGGLSAAWALDKAGPRYRLTL